MKRFLFVALSLVAALGALGGCTRANDPEPKLPYYNSADFTPLWLKRVSEAKTRVTHTLGSFAFHDQNGQPFTEDSVRGRIHVANFFFTTCQGICPRMSREFERLQDSLRGTTVLLVSYSVTPTIDSVGRLHEYAQEVGARYDQWRMLTGRKQSIYDLARKGYFAEEAVGYSRDSTRFLHTEHFVLVDATGRIRGIYNGTLRLETERLLADVRTLLASSVSD